MSKNNYFKNKTILITGANQGLGYQIAKRFAIKNANLILCGRDKKKNLIANKNIKYLSKGKVLFYNLDISESVKVDNFFKNFLKFKKIDILINNAGIYGPIGKTENLKWKEWKETININLLGSVYFINKILPHFRKNNYGKIIQMSGGGAASAFPNFSPYAVSKAGIVRFIENVSLETKGKKIFANAIAPGTIDTRMLDKVIKSNPSIVGENFYKTSVRHKKNGGTDINKILDLIEFLSHKKSDGISGKLISVLWDNWQNFNKIKKYLNKSDVGNLRRIAGRDRKLGLFDND